MITLTKDDLSRLQLSELLLQPHVCNAPFLALNFAQTGLINACCMSRRHVLGVYPKNTILQAWTGEKIKELREAIDRFDFSKGCNMCHKQILSGNYENSLLKKFQNNRHTINHRSIFPAIMEFELSSICNYECIMCGGMWSSSIRKNREKLPPIISPYDSEFVKQLELFIPHLKVARFLGGEPFATPIYYEIWDKFSELNSTAFISVTTNGSIFNNRIKEILRTLKNIMLCISLDSVNPDTYKLIRKNGNLDTVIENIHKIKQEVGHDKIGSIAFCPMRQNWHEIPDIINFCRKNAFDLCFNNVEGHLGGTIYGLHENAPNDITYAFDNDKNPEITHVLDNKIPEVSLFTLPEDEKIKIISFLENLLIPETSYKAHVQGLINRLKWNR